YLGAGTIIIYNQKSKVLDILTNLFSFYKNESCGQCTPCREGTTRLYEILFNTVGKISKQDKEKIDEIIATLENSSFCAFGQCVGMAAKGLFKNFGKEILSAK
ncbi:NADH-quinone oxidoreductase subunit F, partial [bacterium]|nr:NADH-quinone oxidoreductase subunit F [bacterium]